MGEAYYLDKLRELIPSQHIHQFNDDLKSYVERHTCDTASTVRETVENEFRNNSLVRTEIEDEVKSSIRADLEWSINHIANTDCPHEFKADVIDLVQDI